MQTYEMTIPEPVTVVDQDDNPIRLIEKNAQGIIVSDTVDKPWPEYRFLCIFVFAKEEWRKPFARSVLAHEVAEIFRNNTKPGMLVTLTAEQWQALRDTLTHEDFELPEHYSYQLAPLGAAILAAVPKKLAAVPDAAETTEADAS